jgi:hypothetical protein
MPQYPRSKSYKNKIFCLISGVSWAAYFVAVYKRIILRLFDNASLSPSRKFQPSSSLLQNHNQGHGLWLKRASSIPPPAQLSGGRRKGGCFLCSLENLLNKNVSFVYMINKSPFPNIKSLLKYFAWNFWLKNNLTWGIQDLFLLTIKNSFGLLAVRIRVNKN